MSLDPSDAIVVASSFSNMLNLANLAEEVQIAYRYEELFTVLSFNIGW
jgi:phosphoenolpyruvate carboxylase